MSIRSATFPRLARITPPAPPADRGPVSRGRALIAEPDALTRDLITLRLRRLGWQVEAVADGPAALATLLTRTPTVALLALWLPALNAFEVLRQAGPAASRCLILSAFASPELVAEAVRAGARDFILKPVELGHLAARLERLPGSPSTTTPHS